MKKYKFKIDTPWGKKGTLVGSILSRNTDPLDYPDLFEEVPEPSPVRKVESWLGQFITNNSEYKIFRTTNCAMALLAAGLDPNNLEVEK